MSNFDWQESEVDEQDLLCREISILLQQARHDIAQHEDFLAESSSARTLLVSASPIRRDQDEMVIFRSRVGDGRASLALRLEDVETAALPMHLQLRVLGNLGNHLLRVLGNQVPDPNYNETVAVHLLM